MKRKNILHAVVFLCMMVLLAPSAFGSLVGVTWDTGDLYDVSTTDGSLTLIGNTGLSAIGGLTYGGDLYLVSQSAALYTVDPTTAAVTKVGDLGFNIQAEGGVTLDSSGNLWAIGSSVTGADMYTINLSTGVGTYQGSIDKVEVNGLALRDDGVVVGVGYDGLISSGGPSKLFSINLSTFATTDIATLGIDIGATSGLATGYLATGYQGMTPTGTNSLYELNMYTGAATLVGSFGSTITSGPGISGLALIQEVPEPATMLLLGFGFIGIGVARRRLK